MFAIICKYILESQYPDITGFPNIMGFPDITGTVPTGYKATDIISVNNSLQTLSKP